MARNRMTSCFFAGYHSGSGNNPVSGCAIFRLHFRAPKRAYQVLDVCGPVTALETPRYTLAHVCDGVRREPCIGLPFRIETACAPAVHASERPQRSMVPAITRPRAARPTCPRRRFAVMSLLMGHQPMWIILGQLLKLCARRVFSYAPFAVMHALASAPALFRHRVFALSGLGFRQGTFFRLGHGVPYQCFALALCKCTSGDWHSVQPRRLYTHSL